MSALTCADCAESLVTTVWRLRLPDQRRLVLCGRCAWNRRPRDYGWQPPVACCGDCGRIVVRATNVTGHYPVCSPACETLARRQRQQTARRLDSERRRLEAKQRVCSGCGLPFVPDRPNQLTHDGSCRTAAWRRRVDEARHQGLLLPLAERQHQGNPAWGIEWCPSCRENTDPNPRTGQCNWCGVPTRPIPVVGGELVSLRTTIVAGGDRHVAVAA